MALGRIGRDVLVLTALWAWCAGCADRVMLAPSSHAIHAPGAARIALQAGEGGTIEVWSAPSPAVAAGKEPRAFVLRFCGNAERAEDALFSEQHTWSELPVEIWAVNYPGFGGSSGEASLRSLVPAGETAFDALARHAQGKPILISGFSMGAAVALAVAVNRPSVAGLLLRSPPPLRDVVMGRYGWWNLWTMAAPLAAQIPRELDSEQNAMRVSAPAVFVITGKDTLVPRVYQRTVTGAYAGKKKVVVAEEADHNTPLTAREEKKLQAELHWLWPKAAAGAPTRSTTRPARS